MKRIKVLGLVLSAALLLGLLSGCGEAKPIPDGMDEQALLDAGRQVVELMQAGEYETVVSMLREDIRTQPGKEIGAQHVEELMNRFTAPDEVGEFKSFGKTQVKGESEPEPHGVAVFQCKYTEMEVAFGVSFDLEMNLIGISIARD